MDDCIKKWRERTVFLTEDSKSCIYLSTLLEVGLNPPPLACGLDLVTLPRPRGWKGGTGNFTGKRLPGANLTK